MEYSELEEIENVVHYLMDAAALHCLEQQPLRHNELGEAMYRWTSRYAAINELDRTLTRLIRTKCVTRGSGRFGGYVITDTGRQRLAKIRGVVEAVRAAAVMDP